VALAGPPCLTTLPPAMKRIVILISGQGSNMLAVLRACRAQGWPAEVVGVISNRPEAPGLAAAAAEGVPTVALDHRAFASREAFDAALGQAVERFAPDWVLLAGFMRVLGTPFVQRWAGRLVNVHPSLLPAFPGLHTHRRVLEAGCKLSGATVHLVTPALDLGPIVLQGVVPVHADDTEHVLAARVQALEHQIVPQALRWCVEDRLFVDGGVVRHREGASQLWM
jgi:phosphoribosylglycinamide formyltransferase-1